MRLHSLCFLGYLPLLALCVLFCPSRIHAQMVIGGTSPDPSASLDLQSLKKGFLPPRMTTTQRDAIPNPAFGLILVNTTAQCVQINLGSPASPNWKCLSLDGSTLALHASDTLYWNQKLNAADTAALSARFDAKLAAFAEADPLFAASIAAGIAAQDTARWNQKLNAADTAALSARIDAKLAAFPEADPLFAASIAAAIIANDTAYWNQKLNAADTAALSARIDAKLAAFPEADPLFAASTAAAIIANDTAYWNQKLNAADTAALSARIDAKTGLMQTGNQTGNLLYWNGTEWARISPGQAGNVLTYQADGTPVAGMPFDTLTQAQRLAIAAPSNSRIVYQINADTGFYVYKKNNWHRLAAYQNEPNGSLALGFESGQSTQGQQSVAMGYRSGYIRQGNTSVAIGAEAGRDTQGIQATAVGWIAGSRQQGQNAVAVGGSAGYLNQGVGATAVGMNAGQNLQGTYATALGRGSGFQVQGTGATAVGMDAGRDSQSVNAVAIGFQAGYSTQGLEAVAIGPYAGQLRQGSYGIALGRQAAFQDQEIHALAIGHWSAYLKQGISAIALGTEAGRDTQSSYAIAIGHHAGNKRQGQSAIAIGTKAGFTSQHTNSIILNASGSTLNSTYAGALFIAPIRNAASGSTTLHYDPASKEVFYSANTSDLRLKRNIQPIPNGLEPLLRLRPVTFEMKLNLGDTLYPVHKAGFIAQEVQQVLPGLVSPLPGPDTLLTLNTTDMIPLLVKAVQELYAENQILKQETSALREKIGQGASVPDKKRRP